MQLEYAPANSYESSNAAERLIQGLSKLMMFFPLVSELPFSLWDEAISHANWLRNHLPASGVNMKFPYMLRYGTQPELSTLMDFGTKTYAFRYRSDSLLGKGFLPRIVFGYFVGMDSNNTILRIYHPPEKQVRPWRQADLTIL